VAVEREFRFHKNDTIGAPAAEDDHEFLDECFVDTGDLALLLDDTERRVIVLGRTGSGKSALVTHMASLHPDRVILMNPSELALTYISNSTILGFFAGLGINLDPFYKLLWRHVFTVEILNRLFYQYTPSAQDSLWDKLRAAFSGAGRDDKEMKQAVDYLESWGEKFWNETELRVKEITSKMESDLESSLATTVGTGAASVGVGVRAGSHLSEEQKAEVIDRAQRVVASAQVADLTKVGKLLGKVLSDKQKSYYVVVDSLDEDWVEAQLKYKLIRGLILTAREFIRIPNAKVIIVLRRDLIDRVFKLTRDAGFQEEKYQGLYLPLEWSKQNILQMLDLRVGKMVRRRYTKQPVSYADLLPANYDGCPIGDYIAKVATRPRDVIALFNTCIEVATDETRLSPHEFSQALHQYSRSRLRALADEWAADYPLLLEFIDVLRNRTASFKAGGITSEQLQDVCLNGVISNADGRGVLFEMASSLIDGIGSVDTFRSTLLQVFYRVGLVGLKVSPHEAAYWSHDTSQALALNQIDLSTSVCVAPKYAIALHVR
jgi:energy-coupling factor transporter ATP-binding protein EcfA2